MVSASIEGPASPRVDGELQGGRGEHFGCSSTLAVLAHELLVRDGNDHARGGTTLEHLARLAADELECVEPFAQDLGRQDFDRHARERVWVAVFLTGFRR